ncbi:hypothetical protein QM012_002203 [Aureobasidium pullulans]|uniref:C2H2-type domain-containing protein n=1 Tax=Aureobasidium pullulans TaxID=5580 RepID=A0ABR0TB86_AURPU
MPSPELNHAINHTTLSRLQSLLRRVCDASPAALALVERELLAPPVLPMPTSTAVIDLTTTVDYETPSTIISTTQTETGVKRQRYAMCENCKEEFDVTENDNGSCQYHDGELEVEWDSSTWDDWDENCHGTIDLDLADEYPDGFVWSCCEETNESEGCTTGPHVVDETYRPETKKRRIWE